MILTLLKASTPQLTKQVVRCLQLLQIHEQVTLDVAVVGSHDENQDHEYVNLHPGDDLLEALRQALLRHLHLARDTEGGPGSEGHRWGFQEGGWG